MCIMQPYRHMNLIRSRFLVVQSTFVQSSEPTLSETLLSDTLQARLYHSKPRVTLVEGVVVHPTHPVWMVACT